MDPSTLFSQSKTKFSKLIALFGMKLIKKMKSQIGYTISLLRVVCNFETQPIYSMYAIENAIY